MIKKKKSVSYKPFRARVSVHEWHETQFLYSIVPINEWWFSLPNCHVLFITGLQAASYCK